MTSRASSATTSWASQAFDGTKPDPFTVRRFLGGVPTNVTSNQIALLASARRVGGEATTNEQAKPRKGGHDGDGE
jgi:hypothetical protein